MERAPKKIMGSEDVRKLSPDIAFVVNSNEEAMDVRDESTPERMAHAKAQYKPAKPGLLGGAKSEWMKRLDEAV